MATRRRGGAGERGGNGTTNKRVASLGGDKGLSPKERLKTSKGKAGVNLRARSEVRELVEGEGMIYLPCVQYKQSGWGKPEVALRSRAQTSLDILYCYL